MRYELTREQCHTFSMNRLYDNFAHAMGHSNTMALEYDCRRLIVSTAVYNEFLAACKEAGAPTYEAAMAWCFAGPKAAIADDDHCIIEPQDGFIIEKEEEAL